MTLLLPPEGIRFLDQCGVISRIYRDTEGLTALAPLYHRLLAVPA